MNLSNFDLILLVVLLLSMALGAWRGLVHEVLSLVGWIAAFVLAQMYAASAGSMLPMENTIAPVRYAAGFITVFVGTAVGSSILTWLIKRMIASVGLRPVDRTLGAAFGVLRGLVILLALTTVVLMSPLKSSDWWRQSNGAVMLSNMLKGLKPALPIQMRQYIQAASGIEFGI